MPDLKRSLPLAFLIALGAGESPAAISEINDATDTLRPGSLRNLLTDDKAPTAAPQVGGQRLDNSTVRMTQWFNGSFFSCFQGMWRRC
jgi:hypothetical protein